MSEVKKDVAILYHDDFDGIVSAAIYKTHMSPETFNRVLLKPMSYLSKNSLDKTVEEIKKAGFDTVVVLDFPYSALVDVWYDHHMHSKSIREAYAVRLKFSSILGKFDFRAKSCARIVYEDVVTINNPNNERLNEIVKLADMYDSADFKTPDYTFSEKSVMNQCYAYLENTHYSTRPAICNFMVEAFCAYIENRISSLDMVIPVSNDDVEHLSRRAYKTRREMVVFGDVSITQCRLGEHPRYAEFVKIKDRKPVKYSCRIEKYPFGRNLKISIGYNKWQGEPNMVNLGQLIRTSKYAKGGGHFDVGGGMVSPESLESFLDEMTSILSGYNIDFSEKEDCEDMEKYGVDIENDDFEKSAAELSKEASISIDEARKKVAEKSNNEKTSDK